MPLRGAYALVFGGASNAEFESCVALPERLFIMGRAKLLFHPCQTEPEMLQMSAVFDQFGVFGAKYCLAVPEIPLRLTTLKTQNLHHIRPRMPLTFRWRYAG